eukprot:CAMPEP_0172638086 /NCGR_PEP_ID=MMETSP1068-20121228/212202_1 /TAXON_ID=35684 /ORGANISM="Pseudopedinella elastica, Strain CCMP716" /LENGTH=100 /DNA_ID=CAMNT_0013450911 /DNA_START=1 /DNA_END=303 /DNA_ORIENTATION=-
MTKAQLALESKSPGPGAGGYKRSSRTAGFDDIPGGVDPSRHGSTAPGPAAAAHSPPTQRAKPEQGHHSVPRPLPSQAELGCTKQVCKKPRVLGCAKHACK